MENDQSNSVLMHGISGKVSFDVDELQNSPVTEHASPTPEENDFFPPTPEERLFFFEFFALLWSYYSL